MIVDKRVKNKVFELLSYKYDKKRIEKYFKENAFLWKELDLAKVAVYYFTEATTEPLVAVRKPLDSTFNEKKIKESVTRHRYTENTSKSFVYKGRKARFSIFCGRHRGNEP